MPALLLEPEAVLLGPRHGVGIAREALSEHEIAFLQHVHFGAGPASEENAPDVGRASPETPQHAGTGIDGECIHGWSAPSLLCAFLLSVG